MLIFKYQVKRWWLKIFILERWFEYIWIILIMDDYLIIEYVKFFYDKGRWLLLRFHLNSHCYQKSCRATCWLFERVWQNEILFDCNSIYVITAYRRETPRKTGCYWFVMKQHSNSRLSKCLFVWEGYVM